MIPDNEKSKFKRSALPAWRFAFSRSLVFMVEVSSVSLFPSIVNVFPVPDVSRYYQEESNTSLSIGENSAVVALQNFLYDWENCALQSKPLLAMIALARCRRLFEKRKVRRRHRK